MKGSRRLLLAMVCLCSAVILAGCSNYSGLRIGWVGSDSHTSMKAKYAYWSGNKQKIFELKENDTLEFAYDAKVDKGHLTIEVLAVDGDPVFAVTLANDAAEELQLTAEATGQYTVRIRGKSTGGSFFVSWGKTE